MDASQVHKIAVILTAPETPVDKSDSEHSETDHDVDQQGPPVSVGEQRIVEIDEIGDQGDGLARVERGFVVIVPKTEVGERVQIQIQHINETVAFADVVERFSY